MDIWTVIEKANEICGILSLIVSLIALFKVSDIQKKINIRVSGELDFSQSQTVSGKSKDVTQVGGNYTYNPRS